jgi:single-strand DNA-binding protein
MFDELIILGYLGKDPEVRFTPNGQKVANFHVAASRSNGDQRTTIWYYCSTWDKLADVAEQYLHSGSQVLIKGRLVPDSKGNPKTFKRSDDTIGAHFEVQVFSLRICGGKESASDPKEDQIPY